MIQPSLNIERELFYLISIGDEAAFREVYELYKVKVYRISLKMTRSDQIAKDIVQDVFLNIWKNREGLMRVENPSSYLFTAVYRSIYQHFRKVAVERKFIKVKSDSVNFENNTEEAILGRERRTLISTAISKLPPQQQLVFKLTKEEGRTREEVAEYLNISPNTVRNHLTKALKSVQLYMDKFAIIFIFINW